MFKHEDFERLVNTAMDDPLTTKDTWRTGLDLLAETAARTTVSDAAECGRMDVLSLIDFDDSPEDACRDRVADRGRECPEERRRDPVREHGNPYVNDHREQRRRTSSPVPKDRERHQPSPSRESSQRRNYSKSPSRDRERYAETHRTTNRGRPYEFPGYSVGAKLGTYDGTGCFETFVARFENRAEYFGWNPRDQLFHLKACLDGNAGQVLWDIPDHITVERLLEILRNRFGTQNQAERYRAE